MKRHVLAAFGIALGATIGSTGGDAAGGRRRPPRGGPRLDGQVILDWNETMNRAGLASGVGIADPLHESRIYAMAHLAMHDALNVIDRRYESYAMDGREIPTASPAAAVAVAAHDVLVSAFEALPAELAFDESAAIAIVNAAEAQALAGVADDEAKQQGMAIGDAAARMMLAVRTGDRSNVGPFLFTDWEESRRAGAVPVRRPRRPERRLRLRAEVGRGDAVRVRRHHEDPPATAVPPRQPAVRHRLQRAQDDGLDRFDGTHPQADRDRPVLDGELTAEVEPHRPHRRPRGLDAWESGPAVRAAERGARRRLHRQLGCRSTSTTGGARRRPSSSARTTPTR